ncbi:MAG: carbohydrate-binding domain-containing protein [Clostridia bacterium]|nr:carbohydrate-binding domain-containing protein [Clostridia bacterium]
MKKTIRLFSLLLTAFLLFSACGKSNGQSGNDNGDGVQTSGVDVDFAKSDADMFSNRDFEVGYDEDGAVLIGLNGDSVSCSSPAVTINGTTVTITDEGTYILSGTLNDGMIIVNAEDTDKPQLVLNGVSVTSTTSAPIYILEADKVFLTLAEDTQNTLSSGGSFVAIDENNIDAAIFSKQDLTLNGSGSLTVISPAGHGIVSKDDLVLTSGTYTVTSASHALDANDSVRIANAALTLDAGKDGIHAENSDDTSLGFVYIASGALNINAQGDGISAGSYVQIEGGTYDIVAGGGAENASKTHSDSYGGFPGRPGFSSSASSSSSSSSDSTSMKAIKSTGSLLVNNGTFTVDCADDAIHSNTSVVINGGSFTIATGDDGFHADETLSITGGTVNITESYEGLEALNVEILGGDITLVASDDGINAAGGTDSSGMGGMRPGKDMFGGGSSSSKGSIVISGGTVYMNASGDGIDANGSLTISGGHVTVCGPTSGDTSVLDYDNSAVITGGTFIGTGAYSMAQTFSRSEQGVLTLRAGTQSAGTQITVEDSAGNMIVSCTPKLSFAYIVISTSDMKKGEEYKVTVGSSSGTFEAE